jgi:hypothetical protein
MRLWSLHPRYLDRQGLLALWREGLLAQKVFKGETKGYRNHPQLIRFREQSDPVSAISAYLAIVADEAEHRGYRFSREKLAESSFRDIIPVAFGQLQYEWSHLLQKLKLRDYTKYSDFITFAAPDSHPLFNVVPGGVAAWEVVK